MTQFLDLPIELLPHIIRHIVKPHHLALCCLVNKTFSSFAIPQLYECIYIYAWHKHSKIKVVNLFETLADRPDLAKWVKKLDLRDFPKGIYSTKSSESLASSCLRGLANCTTLQSWTWTRDQTLSTEILEVLSSKCFFLKELEINGNATGSYNPQVLLRFISLTKISLIMPSQSVTDILPDWLQKTGETLTAFHVATSHITDSALETLSRYMTHLTDLHIAGCPRVTHKGICSILLNNPQRIESLGLEDLSSEFDISALTENTRSLTSLTSLTLSLPPNLSSSFWSMALRSLTARSPLAVLNIRGHSSSNSRVTADVVDSVLDLHALTLRKFSVHRLMLTPEAVGTICASCPSLETLFVVVSHLALTSQDQLVSALARSTSVRDIHISVAYGFRISPSEVLSIASKLGTQVRQLGFENRVYQLDRIVRTNDTKEFVTDLALTPYEHPEVPEQFLVAQSL